MQLSLLLLGGDKGGVATGGTIEYLLESFFPQTVKKRRGLFKYLMPKLMIIYKHKIKMNNVVTIKHLEGKGNKKKHFARESSSNRDVSLLGLGVMPLSP